MTRFRALLFVFPLMVALLAFGPLAVAQPRPQVNVQALYQDEAAVSVNPDGAALTPNLHGLWQTMAISSYVLYGHDSKGFDYWPCFGSASKPGGVGTGDKDCDTILDDGIVVGLPRYIWSLTACDATTTSSSACGQIETIEEDATADMTDDVLYTFTAKQGTNFIYDLGTEDFGPNPYGVTMSNYPFDAIFYYDVNFGTMGKTGTNNGDCFGAYKYPLTSITSITYPYSLPSNKTCVAPVAGPVMMSATVELATPKYTAHTSKGIITYTVTYTKKYSVTQTWTIYLQ